MTPAIASEIAFSLVKKMDLTFYSGRCDVFEHGGGGSGDDVEYGGDDIGGGDLDGGGGDESGDDRCGP